MGDSENLRSGSVRQWVHVVSLLALSAFVYHCAGTKTEGSVSHSSHRHRYVKSKNPGDLIAIELAGHHNEKDSAVFSPDRSFDIPFVLNDQVSSWIHVFTTTLRDRYALWLSRLGQYAPYMEEVLESYGVPKDLIYLSMIESGMNPKAYSHASAAGLWQFIRSTGKLYDLDVNQWIDERQDIMKATHAGAKHLRDLYNQFGDWYLAWAAYNAGSGKVSRAIRATGTRDFWKISRYRRAFRQETRDYVPKILAAAYIAKHREKFGFSEVEFMPSLNFETVQVDGGLDLQIASRCAAADLTWMTHANGELRHGVTPPGGKYELRVPAGTKSQFEKAYAQLSPKERGRGLHYRYPDNPSGIALAHHKVKRRDTLSGVAKKYGVSRKELAKANGLRPNTHLRIGQVLKIPGRSEVQSVKTLVARSENNSFVAPSLKQEQKNVPESEVPERATYTVRKGDSLWKISSRHGVSITELKQWNPELRHRLTPGLELIVTPPPSPTIANATQTTINHISHTVKRGDTLARIAKLYSSSVSAIKALNADKIGRRNRIRAGDILAIPTSS